MWVSCVLCLLGGVRACALCVHTLLLLSLLLVLSLMLGLLLQHLSAAAASSSAHMMIITRRARASASASVGLVVWLLAAASLFFLCACCACCGRQDASSKFARRAMTGRQAGLLRGSRHMLLTSSFLCVVWGCCCAGRQARLGSRRGRAYRCSAGAAGLAAWLLMFARRKCVDYSCCAAVCGFNHWPLCCVVLLSVQREERVCVWSRHVKRSLASLCHVPSHFRLRLYDRVGD